MPKAHFMFLLKKRVFGKEACLKRKRSKSLFLEPPTWALRLVLQIHCHPSGRSFVCPQFSSETVNRISLIFCMKLACKSKKVTKPKLRKKKIWSKFWHIGPKFARIRGFWSVTRFHIRKQLTRKNWPKIKKSPSSVS